MKYFDLISNFWKFNKINTVGASAVSLYNFLIYKWYENKNSEFKLSDNEITRNLHLTYKTIRTARINLSKNGLIKFQTRNGLPCSYNILQEYEINIDKEVINSKKKKVKESVSKNRKLSEKKIVKQEILENVNAEKENDNIPTAEEFLEYAKTLEYYTADLDSKILEKYKIWKLNKWRRESDRPITSWEKNLKSVLPYLIDSVESKENNKIIKIPTIKRNNLITKGKE